MAKAKVLDRDRDFGEVCGSSGARYEQDGVLFDADGKEYKAPPVDISLITADNIVVGVDTRLQTALDEIKRLQDENAVLLSSLERVEGERDSLLLKSPNSDDESGFPDPPGAKNKAADAPSEIDSQLAAQGVL